MRHFEQAYKDHYNCWSSNIRIIMLTDKNIGLTYTQTVYKFYTETLVWKITTTTTIRTCFTASQYNPNLLVIQIVYLSHFLQSRTYSLSMIWWRKCYLEIENQY